MRAILRLVAILALTGLPIAAAARPSGPAVATFGFSREGHSQPVATFGLGRLGAVSASGVQG